MTNFAKDQLRSLVERVERLEEGKSALAGDIREVYAEAKAHGFDAAIMRQVVRLRKLESHEREERDNLLDLYLSALGMASSDDKPDNVTTLRPVSSAPVAAAAE